jgi:hypothetical protein
MGYAWRVKNPRRGLREEAAPRYLAFGLWHRATLRVYKDQLWLVADYLFEPGFQRDRPPAEAFRADPRAARRIPPWLAAILAS